MNIFKHLSSLPLCTILTTGRTGSDFLQSLFDSHPEVLTFNGHYQFHFFWRNSICVKAGEFSLLDLIEEFIGTHIKYFKSRYDLIEGKDRLGINRDESINIDTLVINTSKSNLNSEYIRPCIIVSTFFFEIRSHEN